MVSEDNEIVKSPILKEFMSIPVDYNLMKLDTRLSDIKELQTILNLKNETIGDLWTEKETAKGALAEDLSDFNVSRLPIALHSEKTIELLEKAFGEQASLIILIMEKYVQLAKSIGLIQIAMGKKPKVEDMETEEETFFEMKEPETVPREDETPLEAATRAANLVPEDLIRGANEIIEKRRRGRPRKNA